ncbi:MAG: hypothetical protein F6K37_35415, partial [Moorea sp. SIO4E2]
MSDCIKTEQLGHDKSPNLSKRKSLTSDFCYKYIDRPDLTTLTTLPTLPILIDPSADFYGIPPSAIALLGCFAVKCNGPSISRKRSHSPHLLHLAHCTVLSNCLDYLI